MNNRYHSLSLRMTSRCLVMMLFVLLAGNLSRTNPCEANEREDQQRPSWTTSRVTGTPEPPPPLRVEPAFPQLTFDRPLDLAMIPGSDRWVVVQQQGKIFSFPDDADVQAPDLVHDLRESHPQATSVYAITFHPDFVSNRRLYLCYIEGNDQPDGTFVSEFVLRDTDPPTLDPESERVIIRWWSGGHNGCCLKFGPDGYLYISTGDGGGPDPPDPLLAGQDVTNLLSAILRIDVDSPTDELPYRIPTDNPLIDFPDARPEIWAYGFRNPWRMSFDREQGDLWVGDVGWQLWEMVYRVEKGGNYGWAIVEGPQSVLPETPRGPTPILPPVVSHPHSEAASITGGFVYHGSDFPELQGAYLYGDFQTGFVWGLRYDGEQVTWQERLAETPLSLVAFAEHHSGELYLLDYQRSQQVFRLVRNDVQSDESEFPRRLSETGIFSNTAFQTPATGVIPYDIQAKHWSDHTTSQRWFALPGSDPIRAAPQGNWEFPDGSVIAKTVSIDLEYNRPDSRRRLETQILHREAGSWRPYTYVWNDEQTDALLAEAEGDVLALSIRDSRIPEGIRTQKYRIASRAECQLCHNQWVETRTTTFGVQTASLLGVNTPQLNRSPPDAPSALHEAPHERTEASVTELNSTTAPPGGSENQLVLLQQTGWLAGDFPASPAELPAMVDPHDAQADLDLRARSYLHVNCAHCHQRHAGGTATIELTWDTQLSEAKMIGTRPAQGSFGIADARILAPGDPYRSLLYYRMATTGSGRMPRIGSTELDVQGLQLLHDWIATLPESESESEKESEKETRPMEIDIRGRLAELSDASGSERRRQLERLIETTRPALAMQRHLDTGEVTGELHKEIVSTAIAHPQAEIRDLFERFLPESERTERLGNVVDPADILERTGDAERGREIFFRDGSTSCKSCHRLHDSGVELGPDLSEIGKKYPPKDMLLHLLEPSRFIDPKYVTHVLETVDGRIFTGLLVSQTEGASEEVKEDVKGEVVLKTAQNEEIRVGADDIELLVPQQKSLMPDLLLRDLTPQEAADLLAFLLSLK
jgi:putative heme-binding domain-containing protein